jgi:hypothetical protein
MPPPDPSPPAVSGASEVRRCLLRVVGILQLEPEAAGRLQRAGFEEVGFSPEEQNAIRDQYYPEMVDILFDASVSKGSEDRPESSARHFARRLDWTLDVGGRNGVKLGSCQLEQAEITWFTEPSLATLGLSFELGRPVTLQVVSDLSFQLRSSAARVSRPGEAQTSLAELIRAEILGGLSLWGDAVSKEGEPPRSKFKQFIVVDLAQPLDSPQRHQLLYDLGCGVPLGSGSGSGFFAPSPRYYRSLTKRSIGPFRNYDMLPLLDSFTVVGSGLLGEKNQVRTWSSTYYRLYVFNLFVKCSLQHYAARMAQDAPQDVRRSFEGFLDRYEVGRVSFNFLPELIFEGMREGLGLDRELARFRERIFTLTQRIREQQSTRTNRLLGLVSWFGYVAGAGAIWARLEAMRAQFGWPRVLFMVLLATVLLALAMAIAAYVFPDRRKFVLQRTRRWLARLRLGGRRARAPLPPPASARLGSDRPPG